eukprot:scaffold412_cov388-Prasinococcus_capsulatus_cf.AAC.25
MDPYVVLPVLNAAVFLATIEVGAEGAGLPQQRQADMMKNFMRFASVAIVPLTYTFPSAVFMYWISSSVLALGQTYVLRRPSVRRALDLPQTITPFPSSSTSAASRPTPQPIVTPPITEVPKTPFVPEATFSHPPKRRSNKTK